MTTTAVVLFVWILVYRCISRMAAEVWRLKVLRGNPSSPSSMGFFNGFILSADTVLVRFGWNFLMKCLTLFQNFPSCFLHLSAGTKGCERVGITAEVSDEFGWIFDSFRIYYSKKSVLLQKKFVIPEHELSVVNLFLFKWLLWEKYL